MLKGRQMMGVRSKETLKLGGYIFKSFLLATVQNHEEEGSGPVPASPSPRGIRCKIQKESQIQHGGGGWGFNTLWSAGAGPAHSITLAPRILKDTDCKNL